MEEKDLPRYLNVIDLKGMSPADIKETLLQYQDQAVFIKDIHNSCEKVQYLFGRAITEPHDPQCYMFWQIPQNSQRQFHFDDLEGLIVLNPEFTIEMKKRNLF